LRTSKPIHRIWPTFSFTVFHCSTKNNSTMINFSSLFIQLPFLHSSSRPCLSCLLPQTQNECKWKTIHRASAYRLINSFSREMFRIKTRFETEAKGNIHPWAAHRSLWFTQWGISGLLARTVCKLVNLSQAEMEVNFSIWRIKFYQRKIICSFLIFSTEAFQCNYFLLKYKVFAKSYIRQHITI